MICNGYALLWLAAAAVVPAHGQWEFLQATKDAIPPVEVPKEQVLEKLAIIKNDYGGEAVVVSDIWKKLPMPADDYPENLKGVLWMDQFGDYGYQNITTPSSKPNKERILTFGDAHLSVLDPETRMQWVGGSCGGAWTLDAASQESNDFYSRACGRIVFQFVWNEDYTVGSLYQYNISGDLLPGLGKANYAAGMGKVPEQPEGTCPPPEDATKEERSLCAKFIRVSYSQNEGGDPNPFVYPVFEIVGADGVPREPYYTAFLDSMEKHNATMQAWRPLKAAMDAGDEAAPVDTGNNFNISLTNAPAGTAEAPTTAAPSAGTTAVVTNVLALLLGATAVMVV